MNKTQIKKIENAKIWYKESDKFALDYALKNFGTMRDKNNIIDAFEYLQTSFKSHPDFKKIEKFYNSKSIFENKDYLKLSSMLKKFVKSFNQ